MSVYRKPGKRAKPFWFRFIQDGTRHEGHGYATRKDAELAEAAEKLRVQIRKTGMAFSQAVNMRLDKLMAYTTPGHYRANVAHLRKFSGWKDMDISLITPETVRSKVLELSPALSPNNVNKHLRSLKSVFEQAVNDGLIPRNPCRGVAALPVKRSVKFVPSPDQIAQILLLANALDRAYLTVIWQLGARVREVNRLTWEDVLWDGKLVRLWTRKKRGSHLTPRLVEMSEKCEAAMAYAWKERDKQSPYVFTNPMTKTAWDYRDKFFDRLCRLAGLPEMGFHALRGARASELANARVPIQKIRDFLGHSDISTTNIYLSSLGVKVE